MKRGFTLAEILLGLTIVGVIAAITLPGLSTNVGSRKLRAWHGKYCNIIDNGISMAMVEKNRELATTVTIEDLADQLKGRFAEGTITMKDGTTITLNGTTYTANFIDENIDDCQYEVTNDLEGLDCAEWAG